MIKKNLFLIIMILILPVAIGEVNKFSDWVYEDDIVVIDEQNFNFKLSSNANTVRVFYNDEIIVVDYDECSSNDMIKICYIEKDQDIFTEDNTVKINISFFKPNITITREVNKEEVEVGEKIDFDIKIENTGDQRATELTYTDSFPKSILIDNVNGDCSINEEKNLVYYNINNMFRGDIIDCSYDVIPLSGVNLKLKAQVDYFDGMNEKKIYSDLIDIESTSLFDVSVKQKKSITTNNITTINYIDLDDLDVEVGEKFRLVFNISNKIDENLNFHRFEIIFPETIGVEFSNIMKYENKFIWEGVIYENGTKSILFTLIPKHGGNLEIIYDAYLTKNRDNKLLELTNNILDLEVNFNKAIVESSLDDQKKFESGKEMSLTFWIENKNNYTYFKNLEATLKTDLIPNQIIKLEKVDADSKKMMYKTSIYAPELTNTKKYKFEYLLNYSTNYNDELAISKKWDVEITTLKDIEIKKVISKKEVTEGEDIDITVTVKNTKTIPLFNVDIKEIFPENLSRHGKTHGSIDIFMPGDSYEIYKYTITPPEVVNNKEIFINTSATYYEDSLGDKITTNSSISFIESLKLTVKPKKVELDITKSASETKIDLGEISKITYKVENTDDETAYNLHFLFSKSEDVDIIDNYEYYLPRLEPGEIVSFQKEIIKPKKQGTYKSGETMVFLEDVDNNKFNYSINNLNLNVEERDITGPEIYIKKIYQKALAYTEDIINVTLNIENVGDTKTEFMIKDGNRVFVEVMNAFSNKNITYQISVTDDIKKYNEIYGYYKYNDKEFRVYGVANDIKVLTKAITDSTIKKTQSKTDISIKPDTEKEDLEEKHNIFFRFVSKILNFFKR